MADAEKFVTMLVRSGETSDSQFFDFRPGFFADVIRVEWEKETMALAIAADVADLLVRNGYARVMTDQEVEEHTAPPQKRQEPEPPAPLRPAAEPEPPAAPEPEPPKSKRRRGEN